jgi:opacity protein-like surface antigen
LFIRRDIVTTRKTTLLLFLVFVLFPYIAFAGDIDVYDYGDGEINTALGIQGWFTQADAKWQISFPYATQFANPGISAGTPGKIESRLDYRKIDSPMIIASAGGNVAPRFAFDVVYGFGSITDGHGTDTDRFLPSSGGGLEFSQSTNKLDGDVRLWGINFYYNTRRFADSEAGPWGFVLGFLHYGDNLQMTNAVQTVSVPFDGNTFPPPGPFPTNQVLNSTYDFSWNLLKVGVTSQAELGNGFSYTGLLSAYPYVDYKGEGYWNLRAGTNPSDFRLQSPNFIQKSNKGYGYEAALGLIYEFSENVELQAGYRYMYLYAGNGTDTIYFADGAAVQSTLDWVTVTRHGTYAELLFKF